MLEAYFSMMQDKQLQQSIMSVCLFFLLILFKRIFKAVLVARARKKKSSYRSKVNTMNNSLNIGFVLVVLAIWSSEIQQFALSIAAFTVAIVFATKEYIQCFIGYLYYASARPFRINDWIQIQDGVGEVIATDWAKVTLLEVDLQTNSYTGKHLFIPNNQMLLKTVKNLNFLRRYCLTEFTLTCEPKTNITYIVEELKKRAIVYCEDFADVAQRYKTLIEKRMDVEFISAEPTFRVHTNELANICVSVDIFCPVEQNLVLQQKITEDFFSLLLEAQNTQTK